jgi:hypothetical protein
MVLALLTTSGNDPRVQIPHVPKKEHVQGELPVPLWKGNGPIPRCSMAEEQA